jgi:hypothetical protein
MKPDMYYLGLGLILLGLLSLLVLFFSVSVEKDAPQAAPEPPPRPVPPSLIARDVTLPAAMEAAPALSAHGPVLASATVQAVAPPAPALVDRPVIRPREPEQLVVFGSLFLDHARNLSFLGKNHAEDLPPRIFQDFKRIGKGTLICEETGFLFKSGHVSHTYPTGDLEQIVFLNSGLALVPTSPRSPIAIFLTGESDRVKAYIRDHAA